MCKKWISRFFKVDSVEMKINLRSNSSDYQQALELVVHQKWVYIGEFYAFHYIRQDFPVDCMLLD